MMSRQPHAYRHRRGAATKPGEAAPSHSFALVLHDNNMITSSKALTRGVCVGAEVIGVWVELLPQPSLSCDFPVASPFTCNMCMVHLKALKSKTQRKQKTTTQQRKREENPMRTAVHGCGLQGGHRVELCTGKRFYWERLVCTGF